MEMELHRRKDTLVQTTVVKDGQDGAAGRNGKEVLTKANPQQQTVKMEIHS